MLPYSRRRQASFVALFFTILLFFHLPFDYVQRECQSQNTKKINRTLLHLFLGFFRLYCCMILSFFFSFSLNLFVLLYTRYMYFHPQRTHTPFFCAVRILNCDFLLRALFFFPPALAACREAQIFRRNTRSHSFSLVSFVLSRFRYF